VKTSDRLRVDVLGPLRAWRNGTEIPLGPPRQRAVFAALAMRVGRSITRAELITAVWGNVPPASAEGNLHTYMSRLRRALDPARSHRSSASLLVSDATGYAIRIQSSDVDITVFEQACADATRSAAEEDFASVVESLDAALGLWRGDALSGVPGPFAEAERGRLAQVRLTAVERRAAAVLALGGHRELCAELAGLVREHPVHESLRELLMLALYRSGRHTEALEVFRDARRVLVRELGVEPGERLRRRHEQVLVFDSDLDLPAAPAPRPGGFVSVPPARASQAGAPVQRVAQQPAEPHQNAGWESLSPVEVQTATMAAGPANPAVAGHLDLPGRNIQTHVASVLRKLDGGGEVQDEVRRHVEDS
jgi:DNA-binding SARP family transcriptional activator